MEGSIVDSILSSPTLTMGTATTLFDPYKLTTAYTCPRQYVVTSKTTSNNELRNMFKQIHDYRVYDKTTVVWFTDGSKATATCSDNDSFDIETGITACVLKRMFDNSYKLDVRAAVNKKVKKEKEAQRKAKLEQERRAKQEKSKQRARENAIRMKARYEAKLALAIEQEKSKLNHTPKREF